MQMARQKKRTGLAFLLSLVVNGLVLAVFILSVGYYFKASPTTGNSNVPPAKMVQAVTVNQELVQQQVARIKAQELAKQEAAIAWQKQITTLAAKAEDQRKLEQNKLTELKQEQAALQSKTQQLSQLQAQALQKLTQLQTEQKQMEQQNADIAHRLTATKQALQAERSVAAKARLEQQLAEEQAEQQALAKQQLLNEIGRFKALILNAIGKQWIIPPGTDRTLSCQLLIKLAADGSVLNVTVSRSSGNPILDRSAITAVMKASPLPMPQNPLLMSQFKELQLTVKPEGLLDQ